MVMKQFKVKLAANRFALLTEACRWSKCEHGIEDHFCQIDQINLACNREYLAKFVAGDPDAVHILIRDRAGFHLRDGAGRLQRNVRIIDLLPCSPELNHCERLWYLTKAELANRFHGTIEESREAMVEPLSRWWNEAAKVISWSGRSWLRVEANASWKS